MRERVFRSRKVVLTVIVCLVFLHKVGEEVVELLSESFQQFVVNEDVVVVNNEKFGNGFSIVVFQEEGEGLVDGCGVELALFVHFVEDCLQEVCCCFLVSGDEAADDACCKLHVVVVRYFYGSVGIVNDDVEVCNDFNLVLVALETLCGVLDDFSECCCVHFVRH